MVEQQDETINVIETTAAAVEKDVEVGYVDSGLRCGAGIDFELQSQLHGEGCGFGAGSTKEALDLLHPLPHHRHYHRHRRRGLRSEEQELDGWRRFLCTIYSYILGHFRGFLIVRPSISPSAYLSLILLLRYVVMDLRLPASPGWMDSRFSRIYPA